MRARIVALLLLGLVWVRVTSAQDGTPLFPPTNDYYVDASVDNDTPYVGQRITYTMRFYDAISSPAVVALPDFAGFWRGQGETPPARAEIVGGRQYLVKIQNIALYATRAGDITLSAPAVNIIATAIRGAQTITGNTIILHVQPLPADPPRDFDGAVGQFDISESIDTTELKAGEAATLRLRVIGSGNFERLRTPTLPLSADTWRVFEEPSETPAQDGVFEERTFVWTIIPIQTGNYPIPAISFSYFDPQSRQYRTVRTNAIAMTVQPGDTSAVATPLDLPSQHSTVEEARLPLKAVTGAASSSPADPGFLFWLLWLIPPAAAGSLWGWQIRQARIARSRTETRRSRAWQRASTYLRRAHRAAPRDAYRHIYRAILIYFADKLERSEKGLTEVDLLAAMTQRSIGQIAQDQVLGCIRAAEEGRFAPAIPEDDAGPLISRTLSALSALDRQWGAE